MSDLDQMVQDGARIASDFIERGTSYAMANAMEALVREVVRECQGCGHDFTVDPDRDAVICGRECAVDPESYPEAQ